MTSEGLLTVIVKLSCYFIFTFIYLHLRLEGFCHCIQPRLFITCFQIIRGDKPEILSLNK